MKLSEYFPVWSKLTPSQQQQLESTAVYRKVTKGTVLHNGSSDCLGLLLVSSGQLRAFICSDEGREITIYRLFERDICLFSASCMMNSIQFEITISAEKDTDVWVISPDVYKKLMDESSVIANFTSQIMASRFSEVMWLIEQIMWKSFDQRLADFLLEESVLDGSQTLQITHEKIASHLGTAREVVTRMLRYFQSEGLVRLTRGFVEIIDRKGLEQVGRSHSA
jgi:CRP/FNR family transcriptional regulator